MTLYILSEYKFFAFFPSVCTRNSIEARVWLALGLRSRPTPNGTPQMSREQIIYYPPFVESRISTLDVVNVYLSSWIKSFGLQYTDKGEHREVSCLLNIENYWNIVR